MFVPVAYRDAAGHGRAHAIMSGRKFPSQPVFRIRGWFCSLRRWAGLLGVISGIEIARGDNSVMLRHDLTPGALVSYDVRIEGERTAPEAGHVEVIRFTQQGALTLVVLEAVDRQNARRAWMMTLAEPKVVAVMRDGHELVDLPSATALGLPPQASQLRLVSIDTAQADAHPVGGSRVQQAGMLLALDFAHWPNRLVASGESWETPTQRAELNGTWAHQYTALEGRGADRLAVGTFSFRGAPAGPFANVAEIEQASGAWRWRVAKRSLESADADVILRYGPAEAARRLRMQVTLAARERRRLTSEETTAERAALQDLAALAQSPGSMDERQAALAGFIAAHPKSLWLPVAEELRARASLDAEVFEAMSADQMRAALTALLTRWQQAALNNAVEELQPIRDTLRELTQVNRSALHALAADTDDNVRAMAVFALAFGDQPGDLAKVTAAAGDADALVRMWAAYGLAERHDPATDAEVLHRLLDDPEEKVRRRACMAVHACVTMDSPQRARFVKRLLTMLAQDPVDEVHPHAAQALDVLATPADLPQIIEAEAKEEVPDARWQLERTIRRLSGDPVRSGSTP